MHFIKHTMGINAIKILGIFIAFGENKVTSKQDFYKLSEYY